MTVENIQPTIGNNSKMLSTVPVTFDGDCSMVVLYQAKNKKNGKVYIGTTYRDLEQRKYEHNRLAKLGGKSIFSMAIRKYGMDGFEWSILRDDLDVYTARAAERDAIKSVPRELKYNMMAGGLGNLNRRMSDEAKEKIAAIHRGNTYRLGIPHSPEVKQRLRELGLRPESQVRFDAYRAMGPKAMAKRVVCLNTGDAYESASSAAEAHGIPKSLVIEVCGRHPRRITAGGLLFRYDGDFTDVAVEFAEAERRRRSAEAAKGAAQRKRVICETDGKIYESASAAGRAYGIGGSLVGEYCHKKKRNRRGLLFRYVED